MSRCTEVDVDVDVAVAVAVVEAVCGCIPTGITHP